MKTKKKITIRQIAEKYLSKIYLKEVKFPRDQHKCYLNMMEYFEDERQYVIDNYFLDKSFCDIRENFIKECKENFDFVKENEY